MKRLIAIEEVMIFFLSLYLYSRLTYSWWLFIILLMVPDIFMLGYVIDKKVGAIMYNIGHHRALNLGLYFIGLISGYSWLMLIGIILFAHSSLDRVFGFGLKYEDDFKHTHLENL